MGYDVTIVQPNSLPAETRSMRVAREGEYNSCLKRRNNPPLLHVRKVVCETDDKLQSTSLAVIKRPAIKLNSTMSKSNERYKPPKEMFPRLCVTGLLPFLFSSAANCNLHSEAMHSNKFATWRTNLQVSLIEVTTHSSILPLLPRPPSISPTLPLPSRSPAFPFRDDYSYYRIIGFFHNLERACAHFYRTIDKRRAAPVRRTASPPSENRYYTYQLSRIASVPRRMRAPISIYNWS